MYSLKYQEVNQANRTSRFFRFSMRTFVLLMIICIIFFEGNAQIDSLKELSVTSNSLTKARIFNEIAQIYLSASIDSSLKYAGEALKIAETNNLRKEEGTALANLGITYRNLGDLTLAMTYYQKALPIMEELNDGPGIANITNSVGVIFFSRGDYKESITYYLKALRSYKGLLDKDGEAKALGNIGLAYKLLGKFELSLTNFQESFHIYEDMSLSKDAKTASYGLKGVAKSRTNIGNLYLTLNNLQEAIRNYQEAAEIYSQLNNKKGMASIYNNMAHVYREIKDYKNALDYFSKAKQLFEETGIKTEIAAASHNMGLVYMDLGEYNKSMQVLIRALNLKKELEDITSLIPSFIALGDNFYYRKNLLSAIHYCKMGLSLADSIGILEYVETASYNLARYYEEAGDPQTAYYFSIRSRQAADSLNNISTISQLSELQTMYETERSEKEILLLQKDEEVQQALLKEKELMRKKQRIILYSSLAGLIIILLFLIFFYRLFKQKVKINNRLQDQHIEIRNKKEEIESQRDQIEAHRNEISEQRVEVEKQRDQIIHQKKEITDSINYAREIQRAAVSPRELFESFFDEVFIFYQPKDIVSGDFYWANNSGDDLLVAVADCTGHGVPGAFLSILGIALLNEISATGDLNQKCGELLDRLRDRLIKSLRQRDRNTNEGLDIGLCRLSRKKQKLSFSGAHIPLFLIQDANDRESKVGQSEHETNQNGDERITEKPVVGIVEVKGDAMPVGHTRRSKNRPFSTHELSYRSGDRIYMFSDGFTSQFGKPEEEGEEEKFGILAFRKLLLQHHELPMHLQKEKLNLSLNKWMGIETDGGEGDTKQIDDILIVGLRV